MIHRARCISLFGFAVLWLNALSTFGASWPDEPGMYPNRDYINQNFGEHIDPFNGNLQLHYVDGFIPGNGGFNLRIQRSYNAQLARASARSSNSPFGRGWQIHFGQAKLQGATTCQASGPITLELPDGGQQVLYTSGGVAGTSSADLISPSFWKARCDPSGSVTVFSPDGTRYDMSESDGDRFLTTVMTDRNGNSATFNYVSIPEWGYKAVSSISTSEGRTINFSYSTGRLTTINVLGRIWTYSVVSAADGGKLLTRVSPPDGRPWDYTYFGDVGAAAGSFALQTLTQPQGGVTTYAYQYVNFLPGILPATSQAAVSSKSNELGTWSFAYTPSSSVGVHDVTTMTQPGSLGTITYRHFGVGTVASGDVWKVGLLHEKRIASEQTESLTWTPQTISNFGITRPGYMKTDANTNRPLLASRAISRDAGTYQTTFSSFDSFGNPGQINESGPGSSRARTLTYFNSLSKWIVGFSNDETISGVGPIARTRDTNGNLTNETRFGVSSNFTYDGAGNLSSKTDARANQVTYSGYAFGIPSNEFRPEGVTITRTRDAYGNVASESDGVATWTFGYDGLNRITSITHPRGLGTTITWNDTNPPSRTLTRGSYDETTQFDRFGRTTSITRQGVTQTFQHDALGRKKFESLPGSSQGSTITLDAVGRPVSIASPHGTRSFQYFASSTNITNERSNTTSLTYRRFGDPDESHLLGIDGGMGTAVSMTKDDIGTLQSVTQGGITRTYGRDSRLFLTSITEPETGTTTFGRDAVGNMSSKLAGGVLTSYSYDGLNRLQTVSHGDALGTITYTYDGRGKVKKLSSPGSSVTRDYDYDANGNLIEDKLTVDGRIFVVGYGYDAIDGLSTISYPMASGTVTFSPDSLGRPTQALPFLGSIAHHPSGNLSSIGYANGVTMSYGEHSTRQLPNSITAGSIQVGLSYSYDGVGNVEAITNSFDSADNRSMTYDSVDRLSTAGAPARWGNGAVTYGPSGNIQSQQFGTYSINYSYSSNRLASISGSRARTFTYDSRGNVTGNGEAAFIYDNASQLACVNCGTANEVRYRYDGQGRRVVEEKGGQATYFVQSPSGDLQFEYATFRKVSTRHVFLHGKRVASETTSNATPTTTTGSATPGSGVYPATVTLSATVTAGATGSVEFREGGTVLGTSALVGGSASLSVAPATGAHAFTAHYLGDANYQPSASSPISVTINKRAAAIALSAPATAVLGQQVTLSAVVTGSAPTGQVTFTDNGGAIASGTLSGGSTVVTTPGLAAGAHPFAALYAGDANHTSASSSVVTTTVGKGTPSVSVASSKPTSTQGEVVTLTASLGGHASFARTGAVTFMDGATSIGTVSAISSVATLATAALGVGSHSITASYSGDANYVSAVSSEFIQVVQTPPSTNVALASAGAVATASSVYGSGFLASAAINGDRAGLNWGNQSGWNDGTPSSFPDWLQVSFNGSKTIDRVVVYTLQDSPSTPSEPTDTMTFTSYGLVDFTVEGWNGSAWVPLGTVSNNNLVKRTVTFPAFTTDRVRVVVSYALGGYSHITEVEVFGVAAAAAPILTNMALATAGSVAAASSEYGAGFAASAAINGERAGANWGSGSGWNDGTASVFPDWLQVTFAAPKQIQRVVVYTLQDNVTSPSEPTEGMTFTSYGVVSFTVEGWDGSSWVVLGTVTNNNLVKRTVDFPAFTTDRIRVNVSHALGGYSHITELEAWGTSSSNVALASTGATASASSIYGAGFAADAAINGDRAGLNWGQGSGWNDGTPGVFPDWLQVDFNGMKTIDKVVVYTLQDNATSPVEPTDTLTFTSSGVVDFSVLGWNGTTWVTLGTVTGNNKVKRTVAFLPFDAQRIRIEVAYGLGSYSHITEVEAWSVAQ